MTTSWLAPLSNADRLLRQVETVSCDFHQTVVNPTLPIDTVPQQ